ncbi:MAG: hypothetical protein WDO74_31650 [Pseudomonadota bacterium]
MADRWQLFGVGFGAQIFGDCDRLGRSQLDLETAAAPRTALATGDAQLSFELRDVWIDARSDEQGQRADLRGRGNFAEHLPIEVALLLEGFLFCLRQLFGRKCFHDR